MKSIQNANNINIKLLLLSIPIWGLWLVFFFKHTRSVRKTSIVHAIVVVYFTVSMLFLHLSIWIVPYFMEKPIEVLIIGNQIFSIILFGIIWIASAMSLTTWDFLFRRFPFLSIIETKFFSPPTSL